MSLSLSLALNMPRAVSGGGGGVAGLNLDFSSGSVPGGVSGSGGANGMAYNSSNQLAAATAPRIDYGYMYDPINPTRSNYCLQSNSFTTSPWTLNHTGVASNPALTTPGGSLLPDSTQAWQGVFLSTTSGQNCKVQQLMSVPTGVVCTAQIMVKGTVGGEVVAFSAQDAESPFTYLGAVVITTPDTNWHQYTFSFVSQSGRVFFSFGTDSGTNGMPSTMAGGTVLFGEAQAEPGGTATAYIATTTLPVQGASNPSGVLIEPARTNLLLQSNTFTNAAWTVNQVTKTLVLTAATGTGPDGVANSATRFVQGATTGANQQANVQQLVAGLTVGSPHQMEVWMKGNAGGEVTYIWVQEGSGGFALLGQRRCLLGTNWQRYIVPFIATQTGAYFSIGASTLTVASQSNSAGGTYFCWNGQLETGDTPTSDIITTSATVTRTADAVSVTQPATWDSINYTYIDGSVQMVAAAAGSYTFPQALNRTRIKSLVSRVRANNPITSLSFGTPLSLNQVAKARQTAGDTWAPTWSSNDQIYSFSDDLHTASATGATQGNMVFMDLPTYRTGLRPVLQNAMAAWGNVGSTGSDNQTFKACGTLSVQGVLAGWASRQIYGKVGNGWLQTATSAQLIFSVDKGVTWTPAPTGIFTSPDPYASPTITNANLSAPFPIQYSGRDYQNNSQHGSDTYTYWLSTDGWNNRSNMYLFRIPITKIANASATAADIQVYTGGDGSNNANWSTTFASAAAVMTNTSKIGMNGATYLDARGRYVCIQWFYPSLAPGTTNTTNDTNFDIWESPYPWGDPANGYKWNKVQTGIDWNPQGFYNPAIFPPSLGIDGGNTLTVITAGDWLTAPGGAGFTTLEATYYTPHLITATVS